MNWWRWDWAIAGLEVGVGVHNSAISPTPLRVPEAPFPEGQLACCRSSMCLPHQPLFLCSWVWAEAGWSPASCYCRWKSRAGTLSWHLQPATPRACWDSSLVGPSSPSLLVHMCICVWRVYVCVCMCVSECVCMSICMFMHICFPCLLSYAIRDKGSSTFH